MSVKNKISKAAVLLLASVCMATALQLEVQPAASKTVTKKNSGPSFARALRAVTTAGALATAQGFANPSQTARFPQPIRRSALVTPRASAFGNFEGDGDGRPKKLWCDSAFWDKQADRCVRRDGRAEDTSAGEPSDLSIPFTGEQDWLCTEEACVHKDEHEIKCVPHKAYDASALQLKGAQEDYPGDDASTRADLVNGKSVGDVKPSTLSAKGYDEYETDKLIDSMMSGPNWPREGYMIIEKDALGKGVERPMTKAEV